MESSVRVQWAGWSPKLNHLLRALLRLLSLVPLPETRIACILPSTPELSGPPHSSRAYSFSENRIRPGYEQRKQSCTGEKPDSRCHQGIVWHVLRLSVAGGQRRF